MNLGNLDSRTSSRSQVLRIYKGGRPGSLSPASHLHSQSARPRGAPPHGASAQTPGFLSLGACGPCIPPVDVVLRAPHHGSHRPPPLQRAHPSRPRSASYHSALRPLSCEALVAVVAISLLAGCAPVAQLLPQLCIAVAVSSATATARITLSWCCW